MGLLKECYTTSTSNSTLLKTTVSYCSQTPRMHAGTVRTNVCFESSFKRERYYYIMKGCCLDEDFCLFEKSIGEEIGSTFGMDEEDIGQGGSRLSGGQRLRVGIARALYSSSNLILLDDPFSALDRRTSHALMSFILSIAQNEKRTIILVTNEIHMLQTNISSIIFLNEGRVEGYGTYTEIYNSSENFRNMIEKTVQNVVWSESMDIETNNILDINSLQLPNDSNEEKRDNLQIEKSKMTIKESTGQQQQQPEESEHMGRGQIENKVIKAYFQAVGYGVVFLILFSTLLMQVYIFMSIIIFIIFILFIYLYYFILDFCKWNVFLVSLLVRSN